MGFLFGSFSVFPTWCVVSLIECVRVCVWCVGNVVVVCCCVCFGLGKSMRCSQES